MLEYISPFVEGFRPNEQDLAQFFGQFGYPVELPYETVVPALAIGFTIVRYVFQYIAAKILIHLVVKIKPIDSKEFLAYKNSEGLFKFIYYTFSWCWAVSIIAPMGIWENTDLCIKDYPYERTYSINAYYLWELGFYISALVTHFTIETRRKDFVEMGIHHMVTIGLIWFSHTMRLERLGMLVLLVHDVADIFLEGAKLLECVGLEFLSTLTFVGLMFSWMISRLYYFPVKIIRSWIVEHQPRNVPYFKPFLAALFVLLALHIYWFVLILQVAYRKVSKGKMQDVRESGRSEKASKQK